MARNLTTSLVESWARKAQAAYDDLQHAAKAPALFTTEFIVARRADLATAAAEHRRWKP